MQANKALLLSNMLSSTNSVENADIANFEASCVTSLDITVDIDPVQEGSGDPSPDNIRPISGWDGAKVTRTGKNLFNGSLLVNPTTNIKQVQVQLKANTKYTVSTDGSQPTPGVANLFAFLPGDTASSLSNGVFNLHPRTVITGADGILVIGYRNYEGTQTSISDCNNQIELGSTATAYEPYQGDTYNIEFPIGTGTVYGGTLNVETGEMVVTHQIVDMGTLTWSAESGAFSALVNGMKMYPASEKADMISSHYKTVTQSNVFGVDKSISSTNWRGAVILKDTSYSSATAVKEGVNGVQLCYPLATPITLTLDPVEINSLIGENNVWSDTGNVSVRNISCNADFLELLLKTKLIGEC